MRVAIYIRKSRGTEEDLLKHEEVLTNLCNANNWSYDLYKEIGSSQDNRREQYNRMKENIENYSKIVVMALDRLSREKQEQAELTKLINKYNFEIVTPTRIYTKHDNLLMDIQELLARQEYQMIRARQIQGTKTSFERGNWVGGIPTIGYKYDRNIRKLVIDEEKAKIYLFIKELALKGYNSSTIVSECYKKNYRSLTNKDFTPTAINRILKCRTYLGEVPYSGEWRKGNHEPLCTYEEYDTICDYITHRRVGIKSKAKTFPLSNLIVCGQCGALYGSTRRKDRGNREYLKKCWRKNVATGEKCNNKGVNAYKVHQAIKQQLEKRMFELKNTLDNFDRTNFENMKNDIQAQIYSLEDNISVLESRNDNIRNMCENGLYTVATAKEKISKNEITIKEYQNKIEILKNKLNNISNKDIENNFEKTKEVLNILYKLNLDDEKNDELINKIYKTIIDKIEMTLSDEKKELKIYYK